MRPLTPIARWLILPGLSAAGGLVAGLAFQAIARGSGGRDILLAGALLGLATGLAVAVAPKLWVAVLIAPPFGLLGIMASTWLHYFPTEPLVAVRFVLQPGAVQILAFLATAPNVVLHGMRMNRKESWFATGLILAIVTGLAEGFTLSEAFGDVHTASFAWFCVLLNLGGAVALEVALRRSRG